MKFINYVMDIIRELCWRELGYFYRFSMLSEQSRDRSLIPDMEKELFFVLNVLKGSLMPTQHPVRLVSGAFLCE